MIISYYIVLDSDRAASCSRSGVFISDLIDELRFGVDNSGKNILGVKEVSA